MSILSNVKFLGATLVAASIAGGIAYSTTTETASPQAAEPAAPAAAECEVASTDPCSCRQWACPWCAS